MKWDRISSNGIKWDIIAKYVSIIWIQNFQTQFLRYHYGKYYSYLKYFQNWKLLSKKFSGKQEFKKHLYHVKLQTRKQFDYQFIIESKFMKFSKFQTGKSLQISFE